MPGGTGEPPARVPHTETVHRTVSSPLLRFFWRKGISPCAQGNQRRCLWKLPPLKRWTKLSMLLAEIMRTDKPLLQNYTIPDSGQKTLRFTRTICSNSARAKPMSGGRGCFYCKVKAAICRAAARTRVALKGCLSAMPIPGKKHYVLHGLSARIRRVQSRCREDAAVFIAK